MIGQVILTDGVMTQQLVPVHPAAMIDLQEVQAPIEAATSALQPPVAVAIEALADLRAVVCQGAVVLQTVAPELPPAVVDNYQVLQII